MAHPPAVHALPAYTITDLGTLGGSSSGASDLNESGQVTGSSSTLSGKTHAFRYGDSTGMEDLGVAPRFLANDTSYGSAINVDGQVVGRSENVDRGGGSVAFRFSDGAGMINLTDSHCSSLETCLGAAFGISSGGQVVGWEYSSARRRAVLYTDGADKGYFGTVPGDDQGQANAINDHGQVAGWSHLESLGTALDRHAFRYTTGLGLVYLGTLGGSISAGGQTSLGAPVRAANSLNQSGQVTGASSSPSERWHGFLYSDGKGMEDLGVLAGDDSSEGRDFNDSGIVVGTSWNSNGGPKHPVLWSRPGCPESLNDAEGIRDSGWVLGDAAAIKNSGQIVGAGRNPAGQSHAFRITPTRTDARANCNGAAPAPTSAPSPSTPPGTGPSTDTQGAPSPISPKDWKTVRPVGTCASKSCRKQLTHLGKRLTRRALQAIRTQSAADKALARVGQVGPDQVTKAQHSADLKQARADNARAKFDTTVAEIQASNDG
ncbi:HAF repeat-containing protein [Methyloterricola oryzae]|uniref:HAF repeat-containing protein n=1 Tax=Methyloterricola oryzae TaxID=1495050 RepID=UPI0005EB7A67|nr:HAF repeat-containing protein [Methyloterricola oryzae]